MSLHRLIERHWQTPNPILTRILSPFSHLFTRIAQHRHQRYLSGSLKSHRLPIPVIVVGNIHAGGTGKTPITAALVQALQQRSLRVGIISRGYGRKSQKIHILHHGSTVHEAGDEPLLLYQKTQAPTAVGADRYGAGKALLAHNPDLDALICDDGLQHYALQRDVEICVFPATDIARLERLQTLPNGPLREPIARLNHVDFLVLSHTHTPPDHLHAPVHPPVFHSHTRIQSPYQHRAPHKILTPAAIQAYESCVAIAAIARPERFFNALKTLGFHLNSTIALSDHAPLPMHFPDADYVFITEKDAVKLPENAPENVWILPITADIQPDLGAAVYARLRECGG